MVSVAFILFHAGETRALLPTLLKMAKEPAQYSFCVIAAGLAAKGNLPDTLRNWILRPGYLQKNKGANEEDQVEFAQHEVEEILNFCQPYKNIVIGYPAKIQQQVARRLPPQKKIIIYFDAGCDETKITHFAPYAHALIFTSSANQMRAFQIVQNLQLDLPPKVLAGRHGDFDCWLANYKNLSPVELQTLRKDLQVESGDKLILWAGGYGTNLSIKDEEAKAFTLFAETFAVHQAHYQLRITLHPGLRHSHSAMKLKQIQQVYYEIPLLKAGFSLSEINKMITPLDSEKVAYLALGVFSAGPSVPPQAVFLGARAKIIEGEKNQLAVSGIEKINASEKISHLLLRWLSKDRRTYSEHKHEKALKKLQLPEESTDEIVRSILTF